MEVFVKEVFDRITVDPQECRGRPCIRGKGVAVPDVLDLLASGQSEPRVLQALPQLEREDITAALRFAGALVAEFEIDPDIEADWLAEARTRDAELDSGAVEAIPWERARSAIRRRFGW